MPEPIRVPLSPAARIRAFMWKALRLTFVTLMCATLLPVSVVTAQHLTARPAIGKVFGKALDATTKKPAEYATVAIYTVRNDSLASSRAPSCDPTATSL